MAWKAGKRILYIATSSLNALIPQLLGMILSLMVIRIYSQNLWGSFVGIQIWVYLAAHIAQWGNNDYLYRRWSEEPEAMTPAWRQTLISRLPIALLAMLVLLWFPHSGLLGLYTAAWMFIRFLLQSFDPVVIYLRKYRHRILAEVAGFVVILPFLLFSSHHLPLLNLIQLLAASDLLKVLVLPAVLRFRIWGKKGWNWRIAVLKGAFPFFLLGLTGLLQSKTDLYTVASVLSPAETGKYQVLMSLLFFIHAMPNFILLPFLKDLYRLPYSRLKRINRQLLGSAMVLIPVSLLGAWFMIHFVYQLEIKIHLWLIAAFFAVPAFHLTPKFYQLFRRHQQNRVVLINFIGLTMNLLLCLWLVPIIQLTGALTAAACSQWAMVVAITKFSPLKKT